MKDLRYYSDFAFYPNEDNVFTWALSHHYNLIFDSVNPEFVLTTDNRSPNILNYKNAKIVYYQSEPWFLSWTGMIDKNIFSSALITSDIGDPFYKRVPLVLMYNYEYYRRGIIDSYEFLLKNRIPNKNIPQKFCSFIAQNPGYKCPRVEFFEKLISYKFIDSPSTLCNTVAPLPTIGHPGCFNSSLQKMNFVKNFKFNICFENSVGFMVSPCEDPQILTKSGAFTEKLYEALLSNTLPIYWGNEEIHKDVSTKSFINVNDYESLDKVVDLIIEIDNNDDLYFDYVNQNYIEHKENNIFTEEYIVDLMKSLV
jgi:hypothetical protein